MLRTLAEVHGDNRSVKAQCCGRRTTADMVIDLSGMPVGVRRGFNLRAPELCDGCLQRVFREQRATRDVFYALIRQYQGSP